jgi:hypothetical protein
MGVRQGLEFGGAKSKRKNSQHRLSPTRTCWFDWLKSDVDRSFEIDNFDPGGLVEYFYEEGRLGTK